MFYSETAGAKRRGLVVMRAKDGQKLRCEPHSCPSDLDIQKINTVYQCNNRLTHETTTTQISRNIRTRRTTKRYETKVCASLKWKSASEIVIQNDNPVVLERIGGVYPVYICRAEPIRGEGVMFGTHELFGCKIKLNYGNKGYIYAQSFHILTNPSKIKLIWVRAKSPPKNAVLKRSGFYVTKCNRSKSCNYLICSN